ncbi:MAG: MATE family efflux transporter [Clostridiales bacterium]|nr:MATE family efflux transporter [Clostridiales bacterium]
MTPERAMLHRLLLEVGERSLLDAEVNASLEADDPLDDLILALAVCTDDGETLHALTEYLLDHPADEAAVESMLRQEISTRYADGRIGQEECLRLMRVVGTRTELALDASVMEDYLEMVQEGHLHAEAAQMYFDAMLRGGPLPDIWALHRRIRREKRSGRKGVENPGNGIMPLDIPCESATIGKQSNSQRRSRAMLTDLKKKFIGDKAFYRTVMVILLPLVVQQGITSFVNMLDTLMVGSLGEETLCAVGVVNQILMVFNLTIFGGLSGVSIFGSQFAGKKDVDGMRQSFRTKLYFGTAVCVLGITLLVLLGDRFIAMFMEGELSGQGNSALSAEELAQRVAWASEQAHDYLWIMLWGLPAFVLAQAYAGSMREMGKTVATMVASVIAILTNLVLNFLLIFETREMALFGGTFTVWGAGMGVRGAALATVIARVVEMIVVLTYAHMHQNRYIFLRGAFRNGYVPLSLLKRIAITGTPLLLNEVLWSLGMTFINQCYSRRGMTALTALNITSTAWNLFCIIMFAMGNAVSIMVGQYLGRRDKKGARDVDTKLLFITVVSHILLGGLLMLLSGAIPQMFNATQESRELAQKTLMIAGASLPIHAFLHATYFTIRSGGKTVVTFLFDSVYTWCVPAVLAYVLSHYTQANVVTMYFCIQFIDVVKLVIGLFMLRSDFWANNVVDATDTTEA